MDLTIYGEIALDLLLDYKSNIISRYGGAGLYAAMAAVKQGIKVDFLTIYNSEIDDYQISLWNCMGISLKLAEKKETYSLPKYLVTGFRNYQKKVSRPMSVLKNDYNYDPRLNKNCLGVLVFPIGHTIPIYMCKCAKNNHQIVFLDPKPNQASIDDAKDALKYTDILLVNEDEAMLISDTQSIKDSIYVLSQKNISYIIVKMGAKGCILVDKNGTVTKIPAFESSVVCTLGSGDVFGGALAANFLMTHDIYYSIKAASCIAADFIEHFEIEKILSRSALKAELQKRKEKENWQSKKVIVYLAGPFFSEQEINWVNYIKNILESRNIKVLSPLHDNGIIKYNSDNNERKRIFNLDIKSMESSDVIIALLDHDDTGTCFEIGYAFERNIPIIGYRTSKEHLNNMIYCGCNKIVDGIEELIQEVKKYGK